MTKNKTQVFSHPVLPGMAVLKASYADQHFPKHWHETYSIGVIVSGVNRFMHRGIYQYATKNTLCVVNPGELHTGETCTDAGWEYLNILPSQELMNNTQNALGFTCGTIHFPSPVIDDIHTSSALKHLAIAISQSATALEVEHRWFVVCELLFARHNEISKETKNRTILPRYIKQARELLDSHLSVNITLSDVAKYCGVSPYHLARSFTSYVGLPPHTYHLQKRIEHAKKLIQQGLDLSLAAQASGFADSAHLSRHFRRHLGATPGQFTLKQ